MPLISIRTAQHDLDEMRLTAQLAAERELLRRVAEELQPTVYQSLPPYRWPPPTIGSLVKDILLGWTDLQFELTQARAACQRYKEAEDRYLAEPVHTWLRESRAAEKAAHQRVASLEAEVTYLKERLEAEQRARQDDAAEHDRKLADVNRLLTKLHLSRVQSDDDNS